MNYQLSSVKYLAIKQLLVDRLQAALDLYIGECGQDLLLKSHISLKRAKQAGRVLYVCAIAQQLSKTLNEPPGEIATALAQLVLCQTDGQDFTVQVVEPGWIYLELTQSYLASLLQHLTQAPPLLKRQGGGGNLGDFELQYTHARCCSILQLAHTEKLIHLQRVDSDTKSALWLPISPNPIPWFNCEQICPCHPAQWALMSQLLTILDDLYCPCPSRQPINWHKAALNLSQAFQTFYSQCRIWGEVKSQNIHLAQARLGLVLITQSVLRLLLQDQLGIIAPSEL